MKAKNIVKLAKIFDNFIELDSSFVLVKEIKAIRKIDSTNANYTGIEVITPYGTFQDSTDYDTFRTRIEDALEVLREKETKAEPVKPKIIPVENGPKSGRVEPINPSEAKPIITREETLNLAISPEGTLFDDPNFKVVNRDQISVMAPDGVQISNGTSSGQIVGDVISGIVYESGRYMFAAKGYQGNSIIVRFQMQKR